MLIALLVYDTNSASKLKQSLFTDKLVAKKPVHETTWRWITSYVGSYMHFLVLPGNIYLPYKCTGIHSH